jgi:hypothetical protein
MAFTYGVSKLQETYGDFFDLNWDRVVLSRIPDEEPFLRSSLIKRIQNAAFSAGVFKGLIVNPLHTKQAFCIQGKFAENKSLILQSKHLYISSIDSAGVPVVWDANDATTLFFESAN